LTPPAALSGAVGTDIADRPPRRCVRAALPHTVPGMDSNGWRNSAHHTPKRYAHRDVARAAWPDPSGSRPRNNAGRGPRPGSAGILPAGAGASRSRYGNGRATATLALRKRLRYESACGMKPPDVSGTMDPPSSGRGKRHCEMPIAGEDTRATMPVGGRAPDPPAAPSQFPRHFPASSIGGFSGKMNLFLWRSAPPGPSAARP
jgi:hypothetical protein